MRSIASTWYQMKRREGQGGNLSQKGEREEMDLPYLDFIMDWNQNIFFNYHNNNNKSLIALGKVSYMNYKTSLILIKDQIFRDIIYYQISPKTFCQCPCWYPSPLFLNCMAATACLHGMPTNAYKLDEQLYLFTIMHMCDFKITISSPSSYPIPRLFNLLIRPL